MTDPQPFLYELQFVSMDEHPSPDLLPPVYTRDVPLPGDRVAIQNAEYEVVRRVWLIRDPDSPSKGPALVEVVCTARGVEPL